MTKYVGLDVSMEETSVCIIDATGLTVWEGTVVSEPGAILAMLQRRAPDAVKVGLETGPTSTWLWHELRAAGIAVVCIDARHAQAALSTARYFLLVTTSLTLIRRRQANAMMRRTALRSRREPRPRQ